MSELKKSQVMKPLHGPHPRHVVAARLRVSNSGLARGGITEPLTTDQIAALATDPPSWLRRERATLAEIRRQEQRASSGLDSRRDR